MIIQCFLDDAAYYKMWGGKITSTRGKTIHTIYIMEISYLLFFMHFFLPIVNYTQYMKCRWELKTIQRQEAGVLLNHRKGFKFWEIARYKLVKV